MSRTDDMCTNPKRVVFVVKSPMMKHHPAQLHTINTFVHVMLVAVKVLGCTQNDLKKINAAQHINSKRRSTFLPHPILVHP